MTGNMMLKGEIDTEKFSLIRDREAVYNECNIMGLACYDKGYNIQIYQELIYFARNHFPRQNIMQKLFSNNYSLRYN